jgi:hypothetical protein
MEINHQFELHRPSIKGTKLLLKVIKAIIIITAGPNLGFPNYVELIDPTFRDAGGVD